MANKIDVRESYIYVKMTGEVKIQFESDFTEVRNSLLEAFETAKKKNISKMLFDGRELTGALSMMGRYSVIGFMAEQNIRQFLGKMTPLKLAFVMNTANLDSPEFSQEVGKNRSLDMFVTDNIQDAAKWLGVELLSEKET